MFKDRVEAGRRLGERLLVYKKERPVVVAIPRGGIVVGYEVAKLLDSPLDLVIPRKIGAPFNEELAIGAVTEDGEVTLDDELIRSLNVDSDYIERMRRKQTEEIRRRSEKYRAGVPRIQLEGRTVIIVDDGVATGSTMKAAVLTVRKMNPKSIVVAVPVAPLNAELELGIEFNEFICLLSSPSFFAIGQFYSDFGQVEDNEVTVLLERAAEFGRSGYLSAEADNHCIV